MALPFSRWTAFGRLLTLGLIFLVLCAPAPSWGQIPGDIGDDGSDGTGESGFMRSQTLRIGMFVTICAISFPVFLLLLYAIVLRSSYVRPRTLYGVCLGLWGAASWTAFGCLFADDIPLGDPNGPLGGYRLHIAGVFVAVLWFLGSCFWYRRTSSLRGAT